MVLLKVEFYAAEMNYTLIGNFIVVGSMEPAIEIWDIDIVIIDEVQPSVILGGIADIKRKGKKLKFVGQIT
ncbi:hypothetical protein KY285_019272 [Solanum tuberosum]|nr:hypothetical protein KY285_019272 [Solanum tuberosum]